MSGRQALRKKTPKFNAMPLYVIAASQPSVVSNQVGVGTAITSIRTSSQGSVIP